MLPLGAPLSEASAEDRPTPPLPYGRHLIEEDDVEAVASVLRSASLTTGPTVGAFERALAERVGARDAVVCANGTAALHLALRTLGVGPGATAIVPSITFVATANAVRLTGAEVIFADVDPHTGLMGPEQFERAIPKAPAPTPSVVLPVHMNGQCTDLPALAAIARRHGIRVIEDAAHAIGTTYRDGAGHAYAVGSAAHSDLVCFSFHPVKTIAMGEGGAITSYDTGLSQALRRDRSHGLIRELDHFLNPDSLDATGAANPWSYEMHEPGLNYRASEIQCALGLSQLAKLERFVTRRRALTAEYDHWLSDFHPHVHLLGRSPLCSPAWHLYVIQLDFAQCGLDRATIVRRLAEFGILTQVHYYPVHRQPYYVARYGALRLPGADAYYARSLTLPLFPTMDARDVRRVVDALQAILPR
ncbi:MAG: UDP-4-amino-4,6-dideoxy-N-acetyl-beta-L-altrosamine transaminase [Alphaproteobacteria bacterium]|nr:UDP-4-amino-4,6-dideoxy-N-acetyl-beta-L-altrosamine transaminase [Alphaproteobacteria bacterium]